MTPESEPQPQGCAPPVRLALPKGRMQEGVATLLADAGVRVRGGARAYRPTLSVRGFGHPRQQNVHDARGYPSTGSTNASQPQ